MGLGLGLESKECNLELLGDLRLSLKQTELPQGQLNGCKKEMDLTNVTVRCLGEARISVR